MDDQLTKNNTNKCFGDIQSRPKLLLFGYGNPGRGDDALGPMLVEHIAELKLDQVTCLNDMQLLVEHATDLVGFERVIFVDTDMSCHAPYVMSEVSAKKDDSYTSHALSRPHCCIFTNKLMDMSHHPLPFYISVVMILSWVTP